MTPKDAAEIITVYEHFADASCTCFQGTAPCAKCEQSPTLDEYLEAVELMENMLNEI